jgi:hypothetical protein
MVGALPSLQLTYEILRSTWDRVVSQRVILKKTNINDDWRSESLNQITLSPRMGGVYVAYSIYQGLVPVQYQSCQNTRCCASNFVHDIDVSRHVKDHLHRISCFTSISLVPSRARTDGELDQRGKRNQKMTNNLSPNRGSNPGLDGTSFLRASNVSHYTNSDGSGLGTYSYKSRVSVRSMFIVSLCMYPMTSVPLYDTPSSS